MMYFAMMSFRFLLVYYFVLPCTILNAVEPRMLEISYKVGENLCISIITLYLSITKSVLWHTELLVK